MSCFYDDDDAVIGVYEIKVFLRQSGMCFRCLQQLELVSHLRFRFSDSLVKGAH